MSPEVAALVREERLLEAAELASRGGDHATAKKLFERACAFGRAAKEALLASCPEDAIGLAAEARDEDLVEASLVARVGADTYRLVHAGHETGAHWFKVSEYR